MNHLPVQAVDADFPSSLSSIYSGNSRKRYPWLTRNGADGHRGRLLWIKVSDFNLWCLNRGVKYQLQVRSGIGSNLNDCLGTSELDRRSGENHAV